MILRSNTDIPLAMYASVFTKKLAMIAPSKMVLAKMLPGKNNDTFTVYATLANGSSVEQTKEVTDCIVGYIQ